MIGLNYTIQLLGEINKCKKYEYKEDLLPLGAVRENSFSDPTSDTCKYKKTDVMWMFYLDQSDLRSIHQTSEQ